MAITKRGKTWQARISFKNSDGKYRRVTKGGFKTKKEAQLYVSEFKVNPTNGKFENSQPLFYEYFWNWFETFKEPNVSDRTKKTYISVENNLKKYAANIKLNELNREKYQNILVKFGKNHSKSTVVKFNALIHACIKDAVYDEKVSKDFVQRTNISYNKSKTRKIEYLNTDDIKILTNYLIVTRNKHFTSKYMILLALVTGMRLGEIQGLKWKDINFNFKTVTINKSWNTEQNKYQPTKNESSNRIIRVSDKVLNIIKELKPKGKQSNNPVFINQYKTIPSSSAVNKTLRETLNKLNINRHGFHFHSLRHTHVAYLLSQGIDIYIISKRLGHSDIGITTRVYSYLIDEYKQKSDDKIDQSINKLIQTEKKVLKLISTVFYIMWQKCGKKMSLYELAKLQMLLNQHL